MLQKSFNSTAVLTRLYGRR